MILFTDPMKQAILDRRKTVTRRRGKKRWNVGASHLCYTKPPFAKGGAKPFARVRIVSVEREKRPMDILTARADWPGEPGMLNRDDLCAEARREGFLTFDSFCLAYIGINGLDSFSEPCWRVQFDLAEVLEAKG